MHLRRCEGVDDVGGVAFLKSRPERTGSRQRLGDPALAFVALTREVGEQFRGVGI